MKNLRTYNSCNTYVCINCSLFFLLIQLFSAFSAGARGAEAFEYDSRDTAKHGLGVLTAAIFLAGEMAGSGVLALPAAMIGTSKSACS